MERKKYKSRGEQKLREKDKSEGGAKTRETEE